MKLMTAVIKMFAVTKFWQINDSEVLKVNHHFIGSTACCVSQEQKPWSQKRSRFEVCCGSRKL
jgi:hypothetical protein